MIKVASGNVISADSVISAKNSDVTPIQFFVKSL